MEGPGVVVEAKDKSGKGAVDFAQHFAVVACFIVEFSAPWRGSAIIDSGGDSCSSEGAGAEDAFIFDVVCFVSNDSSDSARNDALRGTCVWHPSFSRKWETLTGEDGFGVRGLADLGIVGSGERDRVVQQIVMEVCGWRSEMDGRRKCDRWVVGRFVEKVTEDLMFSGMRERIGGLASWWCVRGRSYFLFPPGFSARGWLVKKACALLRSWK